MIPVWVAGTKRLNFGCMAVGSRCMTPTFQKRDPGHPRKRHAGRLRPRPSGGDYPVDTVIDRREPSPAFLRIKDHNREHQGSTGGCVAGQRKSKRIWMWGTLLVVVVVAVLTLTAMHRGGTHFDPSRLDKVTRGEIDQSVVATGKRPMPRTVKR